MTRYSKHVSVIWDVTGMFDWVPVLASCHHHLYANVEPVPPVIPQPFGLSVEAPSIIAHPPGFLLGDNKLTATVYHNHVWFAIDGHDLGHMLMHLCVPPTSPGPCTLMEFNILLSSRKAKFTAGEVKADGKAVACCTMIEPLSPSAVTPMMVCGAVPVPIAGCGMSVALNSLLVGMHPIDLVAGWVDVLATMIQSAVMSAVSPIEKGEFDAIGFQPMPDGGSIFGNDIRFLGQQYYGYHGDGVLEYKPFGGPMGEGGVSVTRDGATGDIITERAEQVRLGGIGGVQHSSRTIYHPDGTVEDQEIDGVSWAGGGQSTTTRRRTDGGAWETQNTESSASLPWSEGTDVPFL